MRQEAESSGRRRSFRQLFSVEDYAERFDMACHATRCRLGIARSNRVEVQKMLRGVPPIRQNHEATHEIADCDPSLPEVPSTAQWEPCYVSNLRETIVDVRIAVDNTVHKDVPSRFVRLRTPAASNAAAASLPSFSASRKITSSVSKVPLTTLFLPLL